MLLEGKRAIVYGGAGAVGGAVARAFAAEGAQVFLAGRTLATLNVVAAEIRTAGGFAETARVDALDRDAVERHAAAVAAGGRLDISFNAIGLGGVQGSPLVAMDAMTFEHPISTAMRTQFLTATTAARLMAPNRRGVILAMTAQVGRKPYADIGGFGVACAAIEAFCRQLAVEAGRDGIRVVCLRSAGSPDAPNVEAAWAILAREAGVSPAAWEAGIADRTLLKRLPRLAEVAGAAVLMASDRSSAITAAVTNLTCGEFVD
jgi:NAD(P)-dependent dehydrogenase (short-subunit alcohol dehydrogenase family)